MPGIFSLTCFPSSVLTVVTLPGDRGVLHGDIHQLSGLSASGTNRLCPNRALSNAPISAWVPGETRNSANARPPATLMRGAFLGLSSRDRKSTRLNSSHGYISYAVFCL